MHMKKTKIIYGISVAIVVAIATVVGLDWFGLIDIESLQEIVGTGTLLATAPLAATEGASEAQTQHGSVGTHTIDETGKTIGSGPEMNKPTISKKLSKILPSNYPLDTLLRNIGTGRTKSDRYEFYSIVNRGTKAKIKTLVTEQTDSTTPVEIEIAEGFHCLSKNGCLFVPAYNVANNEATAIGDNGAIAPHPLVLHIVDTDATRKVIKVIGVNADCPALAVDTILYRMGSAVDQDAAMSVDPMATPTKDYNFCQRNLCTVSENAFQALQEKEIEYGLAEFKEQAMLDFRFQNEMSVLFGSEFYDNNGEMFDPIANKRKLFMRGLLNFDIQNLNRASNQSVEEFLNASMQKLFSGNNGSERRLLLYGPEFATIMANSKVWQKQLEAGKTEIKWGITWKVIETNFGSLLGLMHPGLGLCGPYSHCGIVVDPANIRRVEQVPLTQNQLDLKKAGIRNSKDITLEESFTLEVTNPLTHGILNIAEVA